ncbi:MAG: lysophospholipid acyltransferase family protein [Verrucomicrobiales bacterium]|nr:lysophospholipid acyltransferase family protein [Verrucomicrobiales bacterium]
MANTSQNTDSPKKDEEEELPSSEFGKFSIYGEFWTRMQARAVRHCPFFLEPILLAYYTLFFFVLCPSARKPVIDNLQFLFPDSPRWMNTLRALRVFWSFSNSITDAAYSREGLNTIDWEVQGDEHFQKFNQQNRGAIVLTAHMGNYDVAAPMFAGKVGKKLLAVRAPERDAQRQKYMQEKFRKEASADYEVRYNADDKFLGIDLARALLQGEYVAIQGDRVLFDVSPMQVAIKDHSGWHMNIPKGPFTLALSTRCEILPLFAVRLSRRRYRIIILPPFKCERIGRDHQAATDLAASQWLELLLPMIRRYWFQWYVFENAFFPDQNQKP